MFVLSQVCAILAGAFIVPSYFVKNKITVLCCGIACNLMFSLQYFFLHAYTGTIINLVMILPLIWYFFFNQRKRKIPIYVLILCEGVSIVCTLLSWANFISIFPLFASMTYIFATWQDNLLIYKWLSIVNTGLWNIYAILTFSPFTIVIESILLIVNIIALITEYRNNSAHLNQERNKID